MLGAGVAFGPDRVQTFLDVNNLKMIVRSHECVSTGAYVSIVCLFFNKVDTHIFLFCFLI